MLDSRRGQTEWASHFHLAFQLSSRGEFIVPVVVDAIPDNSANPGQGDRDCDDNYECLVAGVVITRRGAV